MPEDRYIFLNKNYSKWSALDTFKGRNRTQSEIFVDYDLSSEYHEIIVISKKQMVLL